MYRLIAEEKDRESEGGNERERERKRKRENRRDAWRKLYKSIDLLTTVFCVAKAHHN